MSMTYRRIVAKFGTSLLTSGGDHLDLQVMSSLVEQIARLHGQGKEIVIISSGAIASGRQNLKKVAERKNTPFKQFPASLRNTLRYTTRCVDKGLGILLNAGGESDLKYSLATPLRRLAVSSRQPFPT